MEQYREIEKKAYKLRMECLKAFFESEIPSGHIGGCYSEAEIIITLFYEVMRINPADPKDERRDRFILSKGHNCMFLYCVLADLGYISKSVLPTYRAQNSILQGHPDGNKCPGIEITTGSLGQGLSLAAGMALANRLKKNDCYHYVVLGDGEIQSGMIWEAAMSAAHYGLDHLICFIDRNHLEVNGDTEKNMRIEPLEEKWKGFGWDVVRIYGHDIKEIIAATERAKSVKGRPHMILCETVKGKGISFMENVMEWHSGTITQEVYTRGMEELTDAYMRIR